MVGRADLGVDRGRSGSRMDSGSAELFRLREPNSSGSELLPWVRKSFSVAARHTGVGNAGLALQPVAPTPPQALSPPKSLPALLDPRSAYHPPNPPCTFLSFNVLDGFLQRLKASCRCCPVRS